MAGVPTAWGLDVGVTSLKAMKLRKDGDKVVLEAFEIIEHDTFLSEPDIDKDEIIRGTLRKFLERDPLRGETLFIGVPGSSTFARFVKLPPVDPKKIPEIVRFEAIQQIPFPLDQVNWDYQTFTNPDSPDVEVGIFAMKKELVGQVLTNFRALGLTVHGVQMSPLAVYNAVSFDTLTDGKGTVIIDMGAEHTDLVIMDQGRLWLRTVNIGGNHFTDALAKSFKQPFNRAEQLKKTAATSKYQKQIFQAMRPIFADLVAEIQRSIGHYNSSHRDSRLERIVGMGNPFKLPNLQKYLQQELKMEVIRLDRFRKVTADGRLAPGLTENILPMTVSYGLALQGLSLAEIDTNLLPLEIARQMLWKQKRPWFYGSAVAVLAGVAALGYQGYAMSENYDSPSNQAQREAHDKALQAASRSRDAWTRSLNTFEPDKSRVDAILKLAAQRPLWPMLNLDILGALPQAQAHAPAGPAGMPPNVPSIVILSIDSDYVPSLAAMGGAAAVPGTPGYSAPVGGLVDDHGFVLKIRGYTANTTVAPYKLPGQYESDLVKRAPKTGSKPYYFEALPGGSGIVVDPEPASPWGNVRGPYWQEFVEDIAGIHADTKPVTSDPNAAKTIELKDVDLFMKNPNAATPPSMAGSFRFVLTIRVHVRDAAK